MFKFDRRLGELNSQVGCLSPIEIDKFRERKPIVSSLTDTTVKAAIAAVESEAATAAEKIEMLLEVARGLQIKPKSPEQLEDSVVLYKQALELCAADYPLLRARAMAGIGTGLRMFPSEEPRVLQQAKVAYETALPLLQEYASPEEVAEAEMNLGLVLQALVPLGLAQLPEAVQLYQRSLQVFTGKTYPQEHSILQNNIAIAYLSLPLAGEREEMRQAIALQSFEEALRWVNLIDHPSEYAMLQNNLANVLQYLPSTHPIENNLRALAAYEEALKVRTAKDTPLEYANTIANKANVLYNLPDDIDCPEAGNRNNLLAARGYYEEAKGIFLQFNQLEQAQMVEQVLAEIEAELQTANSDQ